MTSAQIQTLIDPELALLITSHISQLKVSFEYPRSASPGRLFVPNHGRVLLTGWSDDGFRVDVRSYTHDSSVPTLAILTVEDLMNSRARSIV